MEKTTASTNEAPVVTPVTDQALTTQEEAPVQEKKLEQPATQDEFLLEEAIEEELIIEDFTIDGICGVY